MVWTDGSDKAFKLTPRVNHTLTAVPPKRGGGEPSDMPTAGRLYLFGGDDGHTTRNDL